MAICNLEEARANGVLAGAVCAFGVFDGVHVGHQYLLGEAKKEAEEAGAAFVVLTFDKDPDEFFRPDALRKIFLNEERLALLEASGAAAVVAIPFTREFAALAPDDFLRAAFDGAMPRSIHLGADARFGSKAAGTVDDLRAWGRQMGVTIAAHELMTDGGRPITATRIRGLLAEGDQIEEANRLLGRPYHVRGTVEAGRGEGRSFGIRTANLRVPDQLRALADGVYAAYVTVGGVRYRAAVNVGVSATFADRSTATCEPHILDFDGDLYGAEIMVEFMHWLRPMRKFDDTDELIAAINGNIAWVRENL